MKKFFKRFWATLICIAMIFSIVPNVALANGVSSKAGEQIKVQVDVYDLSTNQTIDNVGTDYVNFSDDGLYQSADYEIPPLSKFTEKKYGRIHKVVGNWAPTSYGSCNVGSTVEFSENNKNARIIYYVGYFDSGNDSGESGSGGDKNTAENINAGNNYQWKQTIIYHSNFPDGTDYKYEVVYNIKSSTTVYNVFSILKTYEVCGFNAPALYTLKSNPYWNEKEDGSGHSYSGGGLFCFDMSKKNTITNLYAQYDSKAENLIYRLTYMNGKEKYLEGEYAPNTDAPITYNAPASVPQEGETRTFANLATNEEVTYTFQGWDDSEDATQVVYKAGDIINMNSDKTVYAVWLKQSEQPPAAPSEGNLTGKVAVEDVGSGKHENKEYDLQSVPSGAGTFSTKDDAGFVENIGEPTQQQDGSYQCEVTLNAEAFADRYTNDVKADHHLAADQAATVDVIYTYDANSRTWKPLADPLTTIKVECNTVTITPADITIYMGGDGYSGVVSNTGEEGQTKNGMPTPGYFITLPAWLNKQYFNSVNQAGDLTNNSGEYSLHFVVDGQKDRAWNLKRYSSDGAGTTGDDGVSRFVYRLEPVSDTGHQVRMQFIDKDEIAQDSDDFQPASDKLFATYTMKMYSDTLDFSNVKVQVVDKDGKIEETLPLDVKTGTLTVRGTHTDGAETVGIGSDENAVSKNTAVADEATGSTITAVDAKVDTQYYINDSQVAVPKENVALLADEVFDEQGALKTYLTEHNYLTEGATASYQYLDLVEPSNGNAQIVANQPLTIYWKAPKNADLEKDFTLVHFSGLDRDYSGAASIQDNEVNVYSTNEDTASGNNRLEKVNIDGATYLKFTTTSFSPFALIWTEKGDSGNGGGNHNGGSSTRYSLHYESNGGTEYQDEWYSPNTVVSLDKSPTREGYTFTGWYADNALTEKIGQIAMTSNKTVYAGWEKTDIPDWLNGRDHLSYVAGYEDGTVRPQRDITRAEVASIFYRLLEDDVREQYFTEDSSFSDVDPNAWYGTAVATMANAGILKGRTEECFAPDAPITRAEFAAIASRFDASDIAAGSDFTDISGHWAENAIERAATLGWVMGYEDGSFRPENQITRAEAMAMINRVLKRLPEEESDLLSGMKTWPDNQPKSWYYFVVQEATNSHDYERKADEVHEKWTELREDTDIV